MTNLPTLRVAVAETVPYCGQGETVPNAWARRERAERILLDAAPALLDEVEALRAENAALKNENAQLRGELDGQCSHGIPEDDDCAECETAYAKYLAWSAKAQP